MPVRRIAIFSVHTSPLAQPGSGDGGGMNVYVRAMAGALARAGVECDVFTRAESPDAAAVVDVEPGMRVIHVSAGPLHPVDKHEQLLLVDEFVAATERFIATDERGRPDLLHANYWISGAVAHRLKHALDLPMVATFHTLARVKAEAGVDDDPAQRARVEHEVVNCADLILASTEAERFELADLYAADPDRVEIVTPGVDHRVFHPEGRHHARAELGLAGRRVVLFAGRIQPLKGADLAVRSLAALDRLDTTLVIVGGPSGADGRAELDRLHRLVDTLGLRSQVRFVPPQLHHDLARYYRAADVCIVPSRSESFGLVALEAAACGTPVVAADVGGLRTLVDHGHTGYLVDSRDPGLYAAYVAELLDDEQLAAEMGISAQARSGRYSWSITAARLRRLYADLTARGLVRCR